MDERLMGVLRSHATVTKERALELAREEASRQGWDWREPVRIRRKRRDWEVWTNAKARGGNVLIRISINDGEVTWASVTPR